MKDNRLIIQTLGFDPNWICVIYDLLRYNLESEVDLEVFPNIGMKICAEDKLQKVPFLVRKMQHLDPNQAVLFGIAGPKNKFFVHQDFKAYLKDDDYENIIAQSSVISESSLLNRGVLVDHQCVVSSQTRIGFGVTIKRGAKIGHHNNIGDFTDINPGVLTSGSVTIEGGCEIGTGAIVKNNVTIGKNSLVGMGSVVTKNIPPNSIAYGNPCKVVKDNNLWDLPV